MTRPKVVTLLPSYPSMPSGGHKVQYQYAEGLIEEGIESVVVHPREVHGPSGLVDGAKARLWPVKTRIRDTSLPPWYPIDPRVSVRLVRSITPKIIRDADAIILTGWQIAERIAGWDLPPALYVIYDYEPWFQADEQQRRRIEATFHHGFINIATSHVVSAMIASSGASADHLIPCGVDLGVFGVDVPPAGRQATCLAFPVRREPRKGTRDAIEAARIVRERLARAPRFLAFGYEAPDDLPQWIEFVRAPSERGLRSIYNDAAIFIFPSHLEGWGLPGLEAQACGAALVTSASGGVQDYARDGHNALIVPPCKPAALADAAIRLIVDDALRVRIAEAGARTAREFSSQAAVERLVGCVDRWLRKDGSPC